MTVFRAALAAALIAAAAGAQQPAAQPPASAQQPPAPQPSNVLTLEEAVKLALQRNYDLRRSEYQAFSSEQDRVTTRAAILPKLDFNASVSEIRLNGQQYSGGVPIPGATTTNYSTQFSGSVRLQQLVFDGGKWWNNLAAASLTLASSQASLEEQRLTTVYTVEQRFYELVRQQRQLQVLGEAAARSRDQANFTQRLFEGGRATQADVYAARANRDNDEINRLGQEARVELARQDLAVSIGADPAEPLNIVEPPAMQQDPSVPPPAQDAVQTALARRPSLKAFALAAEAQRKSISAAQGDYWPSVSLGGSYSRSDPTFSVFADPLLNKNSQITGSVNLSWNVFNGFATTAAVEKARINALLAENDLANGRRGVASDVERAVAQLGVARQQVRIAVQSQQTASENLRLARTRQQVGVGTQLEVRDAELKVTQAALARTNALVDGHEAESALRRAMGG